MKKVILLFLLVFLAGCGRTPKVTQAPVNLTPQKEIPEVKIIKPSFNTIDIEAAKKMIDTNLELVIIDISPKYGQGHLPNAVGYYLGNGELEKTMGNLDKNNAYLVYGRDERFSIAGAQKLANAGFKNVFRLQGDYDAWVNAGYEIIN